MRIKALHGDARDGVYRYRSAVALSVQVGVAFSCNTLVGASLLAKVANDDSGNLEERGVLEFFASKLAPTVGLRRQGLLGMPYLRKRWAMAVWEVCRRLAS